MVQPFHCMKIVGLPNLFLVSEPVHIACFGGPSILTIWKYVKFLCSWVKLRNGFQSDFDFLVSQWDVPYLGCTCMHSWIIYEMILEKNSCLLRYLHYFDIFLHLLINIEIYGENPHNIIEIFCFPEKVCRVGKLLPRSCINFITFLWSLISRHLAVLIFFLEISNRICSAQSDWFLFVSCFQSYMEDHLKNKDRLDQEWEALCAYEAEPSTTSVGTEPANMRKNRYSDVLPCKWLQCSL